LKEEAVEGPLRRILFGRGCRPVARHPTSQWRALWRAKSYALVCLNT